MKIKEWLKWAWCDLKFRVKDFIYITKFMYKDKVDLIIHLIIVATFIWGFFNNTDMMAASGFIGMYAFTTCVRAAYWKRTAGIEMGIINDELNDLD